MYWFNQLYLPGNHPDGCRCQNGTTKSTQKCRNNCPDELVPRNSGPIWLRKVRTPASIHLAGKFGTESRENFYLAVSNMLPLGTLQFPMEKKNTKQIQNKHNREHINTRSILICEIDKLLVEWFGLVPR